MVRTRSSDLCGFSLLLLLDIHTDPRLFRRAFSRDPETYSNPDSFKPERFLGLDAWAGKAPELDPREYVFGIGRRACPGQLLAENTLWTVASTVLALLDVCRVKDEDGREVEVEVEYSGESTVYVIIFAS
jgi:cytochrome P450